MDPKNLLKKTIEREKAFRKKDFLAPYSGQTKTAVVKLDKLHYKFRIIAFQGSGIGIFTPIDPTCATFQREASWEMRRNYFDALPFLPVILSYETDQGWVAFPMNIEATQKKFALEGEVIVKNVSDAERFDVTTARFDGVHFWYDEVFSGSDAIKSAAMRECFDPKLSPDMMRNNLEKIKGLTPEDKRAFELSISSWKVFTRMSTEATLRRVLSSGGGTLGSYVIRGMNIEIKWKSASGQGYNTLVDKESLDIVSAGICLDGEDTKFHLKDMPYLVNQGEEREVIYTMPLRNIDFEGLDNV